MLNTLQNALNALRQKNFIVTTELKLFRNSNGTLRNENGEFNGSLQAITLYCPSKCLSAYMVAINSVLTDGYKIIYLPELCQLRIEPKDRKFQFIANQIADSITPEQFETVAKMLERHYPEDAILCALLLKKYNQFKATLNIEKSV